MPASLYGRYQIRQEIGRGGMARVYLAFDPTFRRQVAVKVLPPHYLDNPLLRARFEREARLIATIEHPAIVPVYDFGEQEEQLYLVMRYMPGGSLAGVIRQGPFSLVKAAELMTVLAPALDAVHAQGIVHRDLKPGNVLLDAFGNPALSDFGIAHLSDATIELTGDAIIGTPAYMSPEQVRAEVELDGRSDIYSLGIILFEVLTGRQPYQAATPMSVAMRHLTDPTPEIFRLRPELPESLQAVLDRALAKDRERRYPKASEMAFDLRTLVDAYPIKSLYPVVSSPTEEKQPVSPSGDVTELEQKQATSPLSIPSVPEAAPDSPATVQPTAAVTSRLGGTSPESEARADQRMPSMPVSSEQAVPRSSRALSIGKTGWIGLIALAGLLVVVFILGVRYLRLPNSAPPPATDLPVLAATTPSEPISTTPPLETETLPLSTKTPPLATETLAATFPPTLIPEPIFFDDFSAPSNGWPLTEGPDGGYTYREGEYLISVLTNGSLFWAVPETSYADLRLSVTARRSAGDLGYYGLLCRLQDADHYYYFIVNPQGEFTIGRYEAGSFTGLTPGGWTFHPAIETGDTPNLLEVECAGDRLRFYANSELLGETTDSTFASGKPGLLAASLDELGFTVAFDNFTVYPPAP